MFEELAAAIDNLGAIPVDGNALRTLCMLRDQLDARLAAALSDFDAGQLWDLDAATSLHGWLVDQARLTKSDAWRTAKVATWVARIPVTVAAWGEGRLSGGQVQVIVAQLNSRRLPYWLDAEATLLPVLARLSIPDTIVRLRQWAEMVDAIDAGDEPPEEPERSLHLSRTLDERGELRGSFDPTSTTILDTALGVAERRDGDDEQRAASQRRADALVDIAQFFLDHHHRPPKRRHRPHVNLTVGLDDLRDGKPGVTIDGHTIAHPDAAAWICDSTLRRVLLAGSELLDYGLAERSAPAPLFAAVAERDRTCRWPGCDRKPKHCDAHHIHAWWHNGPTRLDNLILLCGRHHRRLHRPGHHAKLLPDTTVEITTPTGQVLTSPPPRAGPLSDTT
jgi:hypothetical protein